MWSGLRILTVAVLLLGALLATVPLTTAQVSPPEVRLDVTPHGEPILPGATVDVPVTVALECSASDTRHTPNPIEVQLSAAVGYEWVQVALQPSAVTIEIPPDCVVGSNVSEKVTAKVSLPDDAPALYKPSITVYAETAEGAKTSVRWEESVAIVLDHEVELKETIFKSGPNTQLVIPVRIANDGNGVLSVTFKVADNSSDALVVALPGLQVVRPDSVLDVAIDIKTPFENGYMEQDDMLHLEAIITPEGDEDLKETQVLSASITTVGSYLPAPGSLVTLAALVGILAFARRGTCAKP